MSSKYTVLETAAIEKLCSLVRESHSVADAIDDSGALSEKSTFSNKKINELLTEIETSISDVSDKVDNLEFIDDTLVSTDKAFSSQKTTSLINNPYEYVIDSSIYGADILKYTLGHYKIGNNSTISEFTNLPVNTPGMLDVMCPTSGGNQSPWESQYGYRYYRYTTYKGGTYERTLASGATAGNITEDTGWKKIVTSNEVLSLDGGTMNADKFIVLPSSSSGVGTKITYDEIVIDDADNNKTTSISSNGIDTPSIVVDGNNVIHEGNIDDYVLSKDNSRPYYDLGVWIAKENIGGCSFDDLLYSVCNKTYSGNSPLVISGFVDEGMNNLYSSIRTSIFGSTIDMGYGILTFTVEAYGMMEITYNLTHQKGSYINMYQNGRLRGWRSLDVKDEVLSLDGGTFTENASINLPTTNLAGGITLKDNTGYTSTLTSDCLHVVDNEYNVTTVGASGVYSPSYNGQRINNEGFIYGNRTDGGNETRYGNNCIDSINELNAYFGLNLWSNGGAIDHNTYSFQSDSFFAELYTGQPDLGNANAKWKDIYAETSTISTSDRNEKTDINPLDESSKDFIMGLNPLSYKLINGTADRKHYGLVAQDVEELMNTLGMDSKDFAGFIKSPKYITREEEYTVESDNEDEEPIVRTRKVRELVEGEYVYSLRYEEFIAPIIKTMQMQQNEINELKTVVEELRSKIQ